MNKSSRLLYLITIILNNPGVNVCQLAEKSGVSERTVYRDIIAISEAHIPVYYDNGYHILDTTRMPPLNFSSDELIYLYNILKSTSHAAGLGAVASRLADKLRRHLPGVLDKTYIDFKPQATDKPIIARNFEKIEKAIKSSKVISLRYTSLNGRSSRRNIHPYGLAFRRHGWYLIGFCEKRDEVRLFRLVRISFIRMTEKKYTRPVDFSVSDFLDESWGVFRGPLRRYKVRFTGPAAIAVSSTRHHRNEIVEKRGRDTVIYSVEACGEEEFLNWVLSYGKYAELIEPKELRGKIKNRLRDILKKYSK
jgi:predicted DNA-binding transcriptional regulator YafY